MIELYIMRHGETYWNKEGLIQGSSDIALTDFGFELARLTRDGFIRDGIFFDRMYSSPYIRAVQTAETIGEKQKAPLYVDARIREMCFGNYEGKPIQRLKEVDENIVNCFQKPSLYHADENGEQFSDVYARVDDFLEQEIRPLENEKAVNRILIVCHGAIIRAFLTRIRQMPLDEFWSIHQPNCSVNKIVLKDGVFTSVQENILYYQSEELLKRGIL